MSRTLVKIVLAICLFVALLGFGLMALNSFTIGEDTPMPSDEALSSRPYVHRAALEDLVRLGREAPGAVDLYTADLQDRPNEGSRMHAARMRRYRNDLRALGALFSLEVTQTTFASSCGTARASMRRDGGTRMRRSDPSRSSRRRRTSAIRCGIDTHTSIARSGEVGTSGTTLPSS
jgi:hypothetical protein